MFRFFTLTTALIAGLAFAAPVRAEVEVYDFEKPHTQISFFADHIGFSKSHGRFHDFDGSFSFDRAEPKNSSVEVTIKTASIDMDDEKWDSHMKNEDFFNVEKFPEMTFKSTAIEVTGDNTANITGDLTILGVTKPVTLAVVHNKSGQHPFNQKMVAGFSASAKIDRSLWGMTYGLPMMSPEVELRIEVEGIKRGDAPVNQ